MNTRFLKGEIAVGVVLILLTLALMSPAGNSMSMPLTMMVVVAMLVLFGVFAGFIWRENGGDERERFHTMLADRFAYLTGLLALITGIVIQIFSHALEMWLVVALIFMIAAKVAGRIYGEIRH